MTRCKCIELGCEAGHLSTCPFYVPPLPEEDPENPITEDGTAPRWVISLLRKDLGLPIAPTGTQREAWDEIRAKARDRQSENEALAIAFRTRLQALEVGPETLVVARYTPVQGETPERTQEILQMISRVVGCAVDMATVVPAGAPREAVAGPPRVAVLVTDDRVAVEVQKPDPGAALREAFTEAALAEAAMGDCKPTTGIVRRMDWRDEMSRANRAKWEAYDALRAVQQPAPERCDTCEGTGRVDETLGGESHANRNAPCPDCDGAEGGPS